jgi:hypothetical protein
MRFRISLLVVLITALALAAAAFAHNGGPRPDRPAACRHGHVLLHGKFMAAGESSFTMDVLRANRRGRSLKGEQSISVDDKTKIKRRGKKGDASLADLVKDDRLHVLARCKPGETAGSFTLLAKLVLARPAKPAAPESA